MYMFMKIENIFLNPLHSCKYVDVYIYTYMYVMLSMTGGTPPPQDGHFNRLLASCVDNTIS